MIIEREKLRTWVKRMISGYKNLSDDEKESFLSYIGIKDPEKYI